VVADQLLERRDVLRGGVDQAAHVKVRGVLQPSQAIEVLGGRVG
jgi:hypothetical protein